MGVTGMHRGGGKIHEAEHRPVPAQRKHRGERAPWIAAQEAGKACQNARHAAFPNNPGHYSAFLEPNPASNQTSGSTANFSGTNIREGMSRVFLACLPQPKETHVTSTIDPACNSVLRF